MGPARLAAKADQNLVACGRIADALLGDVNVRTNAAIDSMRPHKAESSLGLAKNADDRAVRLRLPNGLVASELDAALPGELFQDVAKCRILSGSDVELAGQGLGLDWLIIR